MLFFQSLCRFNDCQAPDSEKKINKREIALQNLQKANEAKKAKKGMPKHEGWATRSRARLERIIEKAERELTKSDTMEGVDVAKLTNALKVCHQAHRAIGQVEVYRLDIQRVPVIGAEVGTGETWTLTFGSESYAIQLDPAGAAAVDVDGLDSVTIAEMATAFASQINADATADQLRCVTVSGNSTMLHLFAGINPQPMGIAPFTPVFLEHRTMPLQSVHLRRENLYRSTTPPPGDDQREIHLIPEGDNFFAQGLYEGKRPTKIYWPGARIAFVMRDGLAERYEIRSLEDSALFAAASRVR